MVLSKAYPTSRKARRPRRRKPKVSRKRRHFVKQLSRMSELHENEDTNENVMPLANQANPLYAPMANGLSFRRNACNVFLPTAFVNLDPSLVAGNAIYAKYLQMKLRITFPSNNLILVPNQTLYLIHGYVDPPKLSDDDYFLTMGNGETAKSPPKTNIDASYLPWYVMDKIHEEFNGEVDQMKWLPKHSRRGYSILGYNKITVDKDNAITSRTHLGAVTPGVGVQEGGPPQILRRVTWDMRRKIQYTQSDPGAVDERWLYPNDNAIPFVCLFNPQYDKQGVDDRPDAGLGVITVEASSKLWYNDF